MTKRDILVQKLQIDTLLNTLSDANENATKAEILMKYFDKFFRPAKILPETFEQLLSNVKVETILPPDIIKLENGLSLQIIDPEQIGKDRIIGISRLTNDGERVEFYTSNSGVIVRPTPLTVIYLNGLAEAQLL